jgi:hypothetical protein
LLDCNLKRIHFIQSISLKRIKLKPLNLYK